MEQAFNALLAPLNGTDSLPDDVRARSLVMRVRYKKDPSYMTAIFDIDGEPLQDKFVFVGASSTQHSCDRARREYTCQYYHATTLYICN
jgi:hypothetical protein